MPGGDRTAVNALADDPAGTVPALVEAGFRVYIPSVPLLFGNATAQTRIDNALTRAVADGCTGAPALVGASNGSACAFPWMRTHPTAVFVGILPPVDLAAIYKYDTFSAQDEIGTAWGIATDGSGTLPAGASALQAAMDGDFDGIPMQLWYASDDTLSTVTDEDFPTAIAGLVASTTDTDLHDVGALGHTVQALEAVDPAEVVAFVLAHT